MPLRGLVALGLRIELAFRARVGHTHHLVQVGRLGCEGQRRDERGGDARQLAGNAGLRRRHASAACGRARRVRRGAGISALRRGVGVMHGHAPSALGEHVDVGSVYRARRARLARGTQHLDHGMHRDALAVEAVRLGRAHAHLGCSREDLRPALAHGVQSHQARTLGMHADHVIAFRPYRHHRREVAALESVVEGVLGVVGRREELGAGARSHGFHRRESLPEF